MPFSHNYILDVACPEACYGWSNPCIDSACTTVHLTHQTNLVVAFCDVRLVHAELVCPVPLRLSPLEHQQELKKVLRHIHCSSVDVDYARVQRRTPGQCSVMLVVSRPHRCCNTIHKTEPHTSGNSPGKRLPWPHVVVHLARRSSRNATSESHPWIYPVARYPMETNLDCDVINSAQT